MNPSNLTPIDIAITGLRAQSKNMQVIANNIANAQTTNAGNGEPFRRQLMKFMSGEDSLSGVRFDKPVEDLSSEFKSVRMPGHPDADAQGFVKMPNISVPVEMIEMMTASRAYQASAAVMKKYTETSEAALELLK